MKGEGEGGMGRRAGGAGTAAVLSADEVVAELRSGMAIGIGGWGSRRKPMALVRAILRSGLTDLEIVSYGGPDVGLLIAGGHVRRVVCGFVSLDTIPLEPHFRRGRPPAAVPADPGRPGLRRAAGEPAAAHRALPLRRRRRAGRDAGPAPGRGADPPQPRRRRRQRPVPGARSILR